MNYMSCFNLKVLVVWLVCVLLVGATTAGALVTRAPIELPQVLTTAGSPGAAVKGTVTYRERTFVDGQVTLGGNYVLRVQLVDITRAEAPQVVLGEQIIEAADHSVPFWFEIRYDPASIKPSGVYLLDASLVADGKLAYRTTARLGLTAQEHPEIIQLELTKVGPWSPIEMALRSGRLSPRSY
jgi:putative lipoprotein